MDEKDTTEPKAGRSIDLQVAIASIVKELPRGIHITAAEVFEKTKELGLDVSLSTVYRVLNRLKVHGDVSTVSGDRGLRYEMSEGGEDHDHLICLGCGLTIEFVDDLIRGFGKTVAQRKGFEHKTSRFDILGYCSACSAKDQAYKIQQSVEMLVSAIQSSEGSIEQLQQSLEWLDARKIPKATVSLELAIETLRDALDKCDHCLLGLRIKPDQI